MRVLVTTIVHHPEDARILHREIAVLVGRGHKVTYMAPYTATDTPPRDWVDPIDVPRALGRRRVKAVRAARTLLRRHGPEHDLVIVHDLELLAATAGLRLPPVVWDVHEDTGASLTLKPWLPRPLHAAASATVRGLERTAERRMHLVLAEPAYRRRFATPHVVVPNEPYIPDEVLPPGDDRIVYVGHLSLARGTADLVEVARLLKGSVQVDVVGAADMQARPLLEKAERAGLLTWHHFLPNEQALRLVDGALAGLSLLHDEANYRHSMPTKVVEYMAHGVPVVTTPTPIARDLVTAHECGVVVPFRSPDDAAAAIRGLAKDAADRCRRGANGHAAARAHHDWLRYADTFVAHLEAWAGEAPIPVGTAGAD